MDVDLNDHFVFWGFVSFLIYVVYDNGYLFPENPEYVSGLILFILTIPFDILKFNILKSFLLKKDLNVKFLHLNRQYKIK
jgi:hypothetical protein